MTKICRWLFIGFVISLVAFMFEMLVLKVAFLPVLPILTLLVAIVLAVIFLYIDHKFKIFPWRQKPPIEKITDPSIQKNNLISNQKINTVSLNPNSINDLIDTSKKNQDSNLKLETKGNIVNTNNQINLNNQNI